MARLRSSPRTAPRHTGDLYDIGYRFQPETDFTIIQGPWELALTPLASRNAFPVGYERRAVQTYNSILREGIIYGLGAFTTQATITNSDPLAAKQVVLDGTQYILFMYRDTGDNNYIKAWTYDGTTTNTDASTLVSTSKLIDLEAWGDDVYFVSLDLANVYKYDKSGGSFSAVSGSPSYGQFIFMLSNNMCVVKFNTTDDIWEVYWAVDSTPTDWTNAGSGNNPIPGKYGNIKGVGFIGESAYILGEFGAYRMTPTGQASPAFAFTNEPGIGGCGKIYGVASAGNSIFYLDHGGYPLTFAGGLESPVPPRDQIATRLWYSKSFKAVVSYRAENHPMTFIDPNTKRQSGGTNQSYTGRLVSDGPSDRLYVFNGLSGNTTVNYFSPNGAGGVSGAFITPIFDIGREILLKDIDVVTTNGGISAFTSLGVRVFTRLTGAITTTYCEDFVSFVGNTIVIPVNKVARTVHLGMYFDYAGSYLDRHTGIREVRYNCRVVSDDGVARIRP